MDRGVGRLKSQNCTQTTPATPPPATAIAELPAPEPYVPADGRIFACAEKLVAAFSGARKVQAVVGLI